MRYWFFLIKAFLGRYKFQMLGGIVLGSTMFFTIPYIWSRLPAFRITKHIGYVGRYELSDIPLPIQEKLSIGLTTLDYQGLPHQGIATSWQASDSGKVYTFTLNTNLRWQDGKSLANKDISYQFRDTAVEYEGHDKIIIKLIDPFSPLPAVLSRPVFKTGLLGLGSYKAVKIRRNGSFIDSLTLSPVDQKSHLPVLVYHFYPSEMQARTAFKLGEISVIEDLADTGELASWPTARITIQTHEDRYVALFFNTDNPYFKGVSGKNLRQGLSYAIDKNRYANRILGPLNPNSWAYNPDIKKYDLDVARSRQLLAKAEKIPDEIVISTVLPYLQIAENIKKDWETVGIKSKVTVSQGIDDNFQVLLIAQAIPTDPDQYNLWHSTQDTNLTRLNDPRVDKLLEDGRKTTDQKSRKIIYEDFQRFLVEDAPAVFLFHPASYTIAKK